jgi:hypothetical protein
VIDRFHLALLRAAAFLVRAPEREEWLAEWRAELWYVGSKRRTAFCRGAFRDAFWLRRHAPTPVYLQSPAQCLTVLAVLAVLSLYFAYRLPLPHEMLFSRSVPAGLVWVAGMPFEDYRQFPAENSNVAFYSRERFRTGNIAVALASRNLFELLHMPVSATAPEVAPLIVTLSAWRQKFAGDPHLIGRRLTVAGKPAQVAAIISDRVWRLPGQAEGWLLVDESTLSAEGRGYVVARVGPSTRQVCVFHSDGGYDRFTCIPLVEPTLLFAFLLMIAISGVILPAVTTLSLGEYPANRHAHSRAPEFRRWVFLASKIALVLPIVLFGSVDVFSLIAVGLQPHGLIVGSVVAFRWVLADQRRRCPVCLRLLSNPTRIGQPSRTLLEWYGTELLCTKGHGLLHVPEIRNSYSEQRWLHLDSSWSSLF